MADQVSSASPTRGRCEPRGWVPMVRGRAHPPRRGGLSCPLSMGQNAAAHADVIRIPAVATLYPCRPTARDDPQTETTMPDLTAVASGARAQAQDLLAAIRTLQRIERDQRPATAAERCLLARFPGFGPVALRLFPDPVTGAYRDGAWQEMGETLQSLLTPEEYASAKRATFTAFYTAA